MRGDLLDLAVLLAAIFYAVRGARSGLLVGAASLVGFAGGAVLGSRLAPPIDSALNLSSATASFFVGAAVVLVVAMICHELLVAGALSLRRFVRLPVLRTLDSAGGAVLAVAGLLFVAWLFGLVAQRSPYSSLQYQVRHSRILAAVNGAVPGNFYTDFSGLLRQVQSFAPPPVIGGFTPEPIKPVAPPAAGAVPAAVVDRVAPSVLKIEADEPECSRSSEGSGFVISPDHVLTNAHVVAGARTVTITADGTGRSIDLTATVVLFDPRTDVAVLRVPGLSRAALSFETAIASDGSSAAALGYPENGPFTVAPARVRQEITAQGPDIYDDATVSRQVYVLRGVVRPGNSGGPMLSPAGDVEGVVFATSESDPQTGYALTAGQVAADAHSGSTASAPVSTQTCD